MLNAEQIAKLKAVAEEYEVVRRETVQILRAELRRRGMTDAEIDASLKKPRPRKPRRFGRGRLRL